MKYEALNEAQAADFEDAKDLAWDVNRHFDDRRVAARQVAKLAGTTSPEIDAARETVVMADRRFKADMLAVETLMPSLSAFEAAEPVEPFASPEVWSEMSPEGQRTAIEVRAALAAGPLAEYGVSPDTLRVLMYERNGTKEFALTHIGSGVDIGDSEHDYDPARSYRSVMSAQNDKLFQVEVAGRIYDSRMIDDPIYEAKVADARKTPGAALPDSKELSEQTGDLWTWTMLTGQPLTADGNVPLRHVYGGRVGRIVSLPGHDNRYLRVCPAVVIPQ